MLVRPQIVRNKFVVVLGIGVLVLIIIALGVVLWQQNSDNNQNNSELGASLGPTTDIIAPEVAALQQQYSGQELFYQLFNFGLSKAYFQKYDEALVYYEAALRVDGSSQDEIQTVQYTVYIMAQQTNNTELQTEYAELLGEEYLANKERERNELEATR